MTQIELFPNNLSSREPLTLPHNPTYPTNIRSRFGSTTERATFATFITYLKRILTR